MGGRSIKRQLLLGSKRTFNEAVRRILGLEVTKLVVGSSIRLQKTSDRALWKSRHLPNEPGGLRAGTVEAAATSGSSVLTDNKKKWAMGYSKRADLRRKQLWPRVFSCRNKNLWP
jgi:hypothetical protein